MDEFHRLKQLNKVSPRADYALESRARILSAPQKTRLQAWEMFTGLIRYRYAVLAAALFLVIMGGGAGFAKYWESSALSAPTIKAEAQAIDMQIQLTNVDYKSLPSFAPLSVKREAAAAKSNKDGGTATSTPPMTVDQALNALIQ